MQFEHEIYKKLILVYEYRDMIYDYYILPIVVFDSNNYQ